MRRSILATLLLAAVAVQSARTNPDAAERDRARILADPLSRRIARLQADHAVARAADALTAAMARDVLEVQRLRFTAGGMSVLALARAELQTLQQEAQSAAARHALGAALRPLRPTAMGAR